MVYRPAANSRKRRVRTNLPRVAPEDPIKRSHVIRDPRVRGLQGWVLIAKVVPDQRKTCRHSSHSLNLSLAFKRRQVAFLPGNFCRDKHLPPRLHEGPVLDVLNFPKSDNAVSKVVGNSQQPG